MFDVHLLKGRIPYSKFDVYPPSAAPEATRVGRSTCPQRFACEADGCSMFIPFDTINKLFLSTVPHSSIIQLFTGLSLLAVHLSFFEYCPVESGDKLAAIKYFHSIHAGSSGGVY